MNRDEIDRILYEERWRMVRDAQREYLEMSRRMQEVAETAPVFRTAWSRFDAAFTASVRLWRVTHDDSLYRS